MGTDKKKLLLQLFIAAAAILFLILGIRRGEMAIVLQKAVNLCFECIGLG